MFIELFHKIDHQPEQFSISLVFECKIDYTGISGTKIINIQLESMQNIKQLIEYTKIIYNIVKAPSKYNVFELPLRCFFS